MRTEKTTWEVNNYNQVQSDQPEDFSEEYHELPDQLTEDDVKVYAHDEEKFKKIKSKAILKAEKRRRLQELEEINTRFTTLLQERKSKITTSKLMMWFILGSCSAVIIYSMVAMLLLEDLSALSSLIAAVVGEAISYAIYCAKSYFGTKSEINSQLEREMMEHQIMSECNGDNTYIDDSDEDPE